MNHRWDDAIASGLVRCRRCKMIVSRSLMQRGGLGPCVPERDPVTVSGPLNDVRDVVRALDHQKLVRVHVSSQPVGTLYRCLDCPGNVTFDSEMMAWDHVEVTLAEKGETHRVEPMLEVRDEKGDE